MVIFHGHLSLPEGNDVLAILWWFLLVLGMGKLERDIKLTQLVGCVWFSGIPPELLFAMGKTGVFFGPNVAKYVIKVTGFWNLDRSIFGVMRSNKHILCRFPTWRINRIKQWDNAYLSSSQKIQRRRKRTWSVWEQGQSMRFCRVTQDIRPCFIRRL